MKGASKVIMGATVVMVVSLAVVLTLVLVLLAELYCNLILRRRQQRLEADPSLIDTPITTAATTPTLTATAPSDPSFAAPPGVLQAPRSFLFPATKEASKHVTNRSRHQSLHHVLELYSPRDDSSSNAASPQQIGLLRTPPPPVSYLSSPQEIRDIAAVQVSPSSPSALPTNDDKEQQHFIYISNPIYDNNNSRVSNGGERGDTPFETPDTSPSRFEESSSSGSDDEVAQGVSNDSKSSLLLLAHPLGNDSIVTPPLTPMKKLPAEASSVSLRDARSLGTSGSDSVSNQNGMSSSSSGTPCTSPSW